MIPATTEYLTDSVFSIRSSGFAVNTMKSASLPASSEPGSRSFDFAVRTHGYAACDATFRIARVRRNDVISRSRGRGPAIVFRLTIRKPRAGIERYAFDASAAEVERGNERAASTEPH